jgi:hypothetical protein
LDVWKLKGKMDLALLIPKGGIRIKLKSRKFTFLSLLLSVRGTPSNLCNIPRN